MPRNLERRVEILFPVEKEELRQRLYHILDCELKDTIKAHVLTPEGSYEKVDRRGKEALNSQDEFCKEAVLLAKAAPEEGETRVFIPETHHE